MVQAIENTNEEKHDKLTKKIQAYIDYHELEEDAVMIDILRMAIKYLDAKEKGLIA